MRAARCLCGAVQFSIDGELKTPLFCHCKTCRKAHGANFRVRAGVDETAIEWQRGQEQVRYWSSSPGQHRGFCINCGSNLFTRFDRGDQIGLSIGVLDDQNDIDFRFHVFVADKAPWDDINDGLPCFDELPAS